MAAESPKTILEWIETVLANLIWIFWLEIFDAFRVPNTLDFSLAAFHWSPVFLAAGGSFGSWLLLRVVHLYPSLAGWVRASLGSDEDRPLVFSSRLDALPVADVWLKDAVAYIAAHRIWGLKPTLHGHLAAVMDALKSIEQHASDGKLTIFGSPHFGIGPVYEIEKTYWRDYGLRYDEIFSTNGPEEYTTENKSGDNKHLGVRHRLKVSRAKVEELWPPLM